MRPGTGARRRRQGLPNYRLVRYADDFVVMVKGTREHAEALRDEVAEVLAPLGLRLSAEKTMVTHIDEGFDFLGFRIQRKRQRGTAKRYVYTYPSKKALASVKDKVRALTRGRTHQPLDALLHRLNPVLRGWANYFRHGVSKDLQLPRRLHLAAGVCWLRRKHPGLNWKKLRRRYLPGWWPTEEEVTLFNPVTVTVIDTATGAPPSPPVAHQRQLRQPATRHDPWRAGCAETAHVRFGGRAGETDQPKG